MFERSQFEVLRFISCEGESGSKGSFFCSEDAFKWTVSTAERAVRKTAILIRGAVAERTILIRKAVVKRTVSIRRTVLISGGTTGGRRGGYAPPNRAAGPCNTDVIFTAQLANRT